MSAFRDFSQPEVRRAWAQELSAISTEPDWDARARELFAWQFAHVPAVRRLSQALGKTPTTLKSWRDIAAVPQQLFKRTKLYAHGSEVPEAVYETSGTTTGSPGRQYLLQADLYCSACVEGARRVSLLSDPLRLHFLTPAPAEAPHSSLSAMFGFWAKALAQKGRLFWMKQGVFAFDALRETLLERIKKGDPIAVCGTAFSFVHLLDAWADLASLRLPRGSWLLETGGFKGRSREIPKDELYRQLAEAFSVSTDAIWNEYGMSELSSQAYAHGISGLHQTPPWARVIVVDPATNREVRMGQQGLVRWFDLANIDSVMALQTLDLAERTRDGFRLIGRLPRTEPRGCSLSVEDLTTPSEFASP